MPKKSRPLDLNYRKACKIVDGGSTTAERARKIITCWIKSECVGHDIPYLSFEMHIFAPAEGPQQQKCEPAVVAGMIKARNAVDKFLLRKCDKEGKPYTQKELPEITAALFRRRGVWMGADQDFGMEIAVLGEICSEAGIARSQTLLSGKFPKPGEEKSVDAVLEGVMEFADSAWCKYMHVDAIGSLNTVTEALKDIQGRRQPDCKSLFEQDPFMKTLVEPMSRLYSTHHLVDGFRQGVPALQHLLATCQGNLETDEAACTFTDIEPLEIFRFALPRRDQEEVDGLYDKVCAQIARLAALGRARAHGGIDGAGVGVAADAGARAVETGADGDERDEAEGEGEDDAGDAEDHAELFRAGDVADGSPDSLAGALQIQLWIFNFGLRPGFPALGSERI